MLILNVKACIILGEVTGILVILRFLLFQFSSRI